MLTFVPVEVIVTPSFIVKFLLYFNITAKILIYKSLLLSSQKDKLRCKVI